MRAIGATISRIPGATALIAGAAILSGAAAPSAIPRDAPYEEAMAIPRVPAPGGDEVALPEPLSPSEAARVKLIFRLQSTGEMAAATRETGLLDSATPLGNSMLGYVLADRHLGPHSRASAEDLGTWLQRWPNLPDAIPVHTLLLARLPAGAKRPDRPATTTLSTADASEMPGMPVPEEMGTVQSGLVRNAALDHDVRERARRGTATAVASLLSHTKGLSAGYASQLAGEAARDLFTANHDAEALELGASGAAVCWHTAAGRDAGCQVAALAPYMAGLAAWRLDRKDLAASYFEQAWHAALTTSAQRAAAAFWTARAHFRARDGQHLVWLNRAADERVTFYGQVAQRMLAGFGAARGDGFGHSTREVLAQADLDAIAATDAGLRAFALLQVGERSRAEAELRRLWPSVQDTPALARAVMLVADRAGLSALAAQLADLLQAGDGQPRENTRFRIPHLRPDGGFRVDPAMVYALARTESNFDNGCVSSAGAMGMMQIMPETAEFIFGVGGHKVDPHGNWLNEQLRDSSANLDLGQRYVAYLARNELVNGDLLRLLASWNAGPAKFARWGESLRDGGDPFLFIEAIPADETRAFVPRVLTYTWIYAARLRLPTPSLDEFAAGEWPRYHPMQPRGQASAQAAARLH